MTGNYGRLREGDKSKWLDLEFCITQPIVFIAWLWKTAAIDRNDFSGDRS